MWERERELLLLRKEKGYYGFLREDFKETGQELKLEG